MQRRHLLVVGMVALLGLLVAVIVLRPKAREVNGLEGQVVPEFDLQRISAAGLDPKWTDGTLQHRGKAFLLHFWAPSCEPCREELPIWQELAHHGQEFTVLTVAGDESADVAHFLDQHHLTLPTVWDGEGHAHRALKVASIPQTFAISRTGVIVRDLPGAQTRDGLLAAVQAAREAK